MNATHNELIDLGRDLVTKFLAFKNTQNEEIQVERQNDFYILIQKIRDNFTAKQIKQVLAEAKEELTDASPVYFLEFQEYASNVFSNCLIKSNSEELLTLVVIPYTRMLSNKSEITQSDYLDFEEALTGYIKALNPEQKNIKLKFIKNEIVLDGKSGILDMYSDVSILNSEINYLDSLVKTESNFILQPKKLKGYTSSNVLGLRYFAVIIQSEDYICKGIEEVDYDLFEEDGLLEGFDDAFSLILDMFNKFSDAGILMDTPCDLSEAITRGFRHVNSVGLELTLARLNTQPEDIEFKINENVEVSEDGLTGVVKIDFKLKKQKEKLFSFDWYVANRYTEARVEEEFAVIFENIAEEGIEVPESFWITYTGDVPPNNEK